MCVPWELNPQLEQTQCSTTEPQEQSINQSINQSIIIIVIIIIIIIVTL